LKYYKDDGKVRIDCTKPKDITLSIALQEVQSLPTVEGNFVGFINEKDESIQFIHEEDGWLIDVPIIEKGTFAYSLQDDGLSTETVKNIVKKFFMDEDWHSLCNLSKMEMCK
jgi:hypothetical protein